jgi:hypothetical protein
MYCGQLGGLRDRGVMPEIGAGIDLRLGMQPGGDVVAGGVKKCAELHLLVGPVGSHRVLLQRHHRQMRSVQTGGHRKARMSRNHRRFRVAGRSPI